MNTQKFSQNGNFKFPLSTEALEFMQEQIKLAYGLSDLAGQDIIIRQSTASDTGLIIYNGELMPLTGSPAKYIRIVETTETMSIEGKYVGNVRTTRSAMYVSVLSLNTPSKAASSFTVLKSISTLMKELDEAEQHYVPTGAILMWSGTIANIPTGWALCNGKNGTPNLQARFIVGAGSDTITDNGIGYRYDVGQTGGHNAIALSVAEMPKHNHDTSTSTTDGSITTSSNGNHKHTISTGSSTVSSASGAQKATNGYGPFNSGEAGEHTHSVSLKARGSGSAHENRPLYYALAYIMKII